MDRSREGREKSGDFRRRGVSPTDRWSPSPMRDRVKERRNTDSPLRPREIEQREKERRRRREAFERERRQLQESSKRRRRSRSKERRSKSQGKSEREAKTRKREKSPDPKGKNSTLKKEGEKPEVEEKPKSNSAKKKKAKPTPGMLSFGDEFQEENQPNSFKGLGAATKKRLKEERKSGGPAVSETAPAVALDRTSSVVEDYTAPLVEADGKKKLALPKCAVSQARGKKEVMEDRYTIVASLQQTDAVFASTSHPSFYAVFDGHNGSLAADIAAAQLHLHLSKMPDIASKSQTNVQDGIYKAYSLTEKAIMEAVEEEDRNDGTTVVSVLLIGEILYIANVGDSRAVMGSIDERGLLSIERLTLDHKPDSEEEKRRIELAGGRVEHSGCWRVAHDEVPMRLAVSRSLGDRKFKQNGASAEGKPSPKLAQLVSAEPSLGVKSLNDEDRFVILGTDGLWDVLSDERAAQLVRAAFTLEGDDGEVLWNVTDYTIKQAADLLISTALNAGVSDNVTAMVVAFQWD